MATTTIFFAFVLLGCVTWKLATGDACADDLKYKLLTQNFGLQSRTLYGIGTEHANDQYPGVYLRAIIGIAKHIDFNIFAAFNTTSASDESTCLAVAAAYAKGFQDAGVDPADILNSPGSISGELEYHGALISYGLSFTNMLEAYNKSVNVTNPTKYQSIIVGFNSNDNMQVEVAAKNDGAACLALARKVGLYGVKTFQSLGDNITSTDCSGPVSI